MIRTRTTCRTCGSAGLLPVLDLGKTPLANDFLLPQEVPGYARSFPLRLCVCRDCSLAQLGETVDPEVLYSRYAYFTSTSRTMEEHLSAQAKHLLSLLPSNPGQRRVLEIASNNGFYLQKFQALGCEVLGVEPAKNIAEVAVQSGVPTRAVFFQAATAKTIAQEWGRADLILGRHVFAHIDDLRDLVSALEAISHPATLVAFEVPYLVDFFEKAEFDTIYHEHLSYVSARAVEALVRNTPFFLQRIDHYPIHGGSILFHLRHRSSGIAAHASVAESLAKEAKLELDKVKSWEPFCRQVRRTQEELPKLVRTLKSQGKRLIGYGASAKGSTLLNTCGITKADLDFIIDNTPFKQNKLAPGSWLPIVHPDQLLAAQPDYALILAWNFAPEIIGREQEFQRRGGRFIIPIPEPRIVEFA